MTRNKTWLNIVPVSSAHAEAVEGRVNFWIWRRVVWKGLTVRRCPGLRDFLGYKVLPLVSGKTGQVPGKLGCVGHPSPSTGSIKNIRAWGLWASQLWRMGKKKGCCCVFTLRLSATGTRFWGGPPGASSSWARTHHFPDFSWGFQKRFV